MTNPNVYRWIKTPCGRAKYTSLSARQGVLSKIRLAWFILFAMIADWKIPNPDQGNDSSS